MRPCHNNISVLQVQGHETNSSGSTGKTSTEALERHSYISLDERLWGCKSQSHSIAAARALRQCTVCDSDWCNTESHDWKIYLLAL